MFGFIKNIIDNVLKRGKAESISDERLFINEINNFINSEKRSLMIAGERYYKGDHDILARKRTMIGQNGELQTVDNLPNNRIVDNQYRKMIEQKSNYLLGKPIAVKTDNRPYHDCLRKFFNKSFNKLMKNIAKDSLNSGIAWMFIHYNEQGELSFKRFRASEIIPGWADAEHTYLQYAIRLYDVIVYEGTRKKRIRKVEVYDDKGIHFFELSESRSLKPVEPFHQDYFTLVDGEGERSYNWSKIPLIAFKYNDEEIPLIKMIKSLQDGLNLIQSNFQNQMEEDTRNTILVLVNYDGENLGEFRRNLATYGAVKVSTVDGMSGDLKTLQVEVNSENYKSIIELFKKAIIENAMGYDAKDDRMAGSPNQMNIQSMYSDIDLDANGMETEYQASFEELLYFVNAHLHNTGQGSFEGESVEIIFNRDILINESEVIDNCTKSMGIISDETIIAMHPWIDDPVAELEKVKKQKEEAVADFGFKQNPEDE